jgi:hypothetical protein
LAQACHPSYTGSLNRRIAVQASPDINVRPFPKKITKAKRAGGVAQVVECLPSKFKALSSKPSTEKKKLKVQTI